MVRLTRGRRLGAVALALVASLWVALVTSVARAAPAAAPPDAPVASLAAPGIPDGWEVVREGPFRFVHPPGQGRAARTLAERSQEDLRTLVEYVGRDPGAPISIWLADSPERFRALQPGRAPGWASGTAWPEPGWIFLDAGSARSSGDLQQVFVHELAHVVLGRATGDRPVPRWLREGLAQFVAREYGPSTWATLADAALGGDVVPLSRLDVGFPAEPALARIAYAQSVDFVAWLLDRFGPGAVRAMVRDLAAGNSPDDALRSATGSSLSELEARWREHLQLTHGWVTVLGGGGAVWGFATVLFLLAGVRRTREKRRALKEMEAQEAREAEARRLPVPRVPTDAVASGPPPDPLPTGGPDGGGGPDPEGEDAEPPGDERPPLFRGAAYRDDLGQTQGRRFLARDPGADEVVH